jgi:NAD(P)-dependent dehydrogenase (short-subunit alcohol dehydrogenase family)
VKSPRAVVHAGVWDRTIAIILSALFYAVRTELPAIAGAGGGAVVNVSSVFADRGMPTRANGDGGEQAEI